MIRQWEMFAQRQDDLVDGREFMHFGDEPWVRKCYGEPVVPVVLTEDPDGGYWGWLDTGDEAPDMIQPHWGMFTMQFAYGPEAEVKRGKGEIVRLRVAATREDQP